MKTRRRKSLLEAGIDRILAMEDDVKRLKAKIRRNRAAARRHIDNVAGGVRTVHLSVAASIRADRAESDLLSLTMELGAFRRGLAQLCA